MTYKLFAQNKLETMKAFSVKFLNGHFIDQDTEKRIILVQNGIYTISANDSAFVEEDEKLIIAAGLEKELKAKEIQEKHKNTDTIIFLPANTELLFRIGNSKSLKGDQSYAHFLTCILLEDLYIYFVKNGTNEKNDPIAWRLSRCKCQLKESKIGGLVLTEKIVGNSLNDLFTKTVMFYFSLQRSGSINVFSNFYLYDSNKRIEPSYDLSRQFVSLGVRRESFIKNKGNNFDKP